MVTDTINNNQMPQRTNSFSNEENEENEVMCNSQSPNVNDTSLNGMEMEMLTSQSNGVGCTMNGNGNVNCTVKKAENKNAKNVAIPVDAASEEVFPCHPAPAVEVKLFVSKVPRACVEEDLRPIFETFGKVLSVSIIRDKNTSYHKGAAFVKMACLAQADAAIRDLSKKKVIDESLGPIQVKYATGESERLGMLETAEGSVEQPKLFVGNLPKTMNEEEVKNFFAPYGQVDDVYIMRDPSNSLGKGCAFVKYAFKEQAIHAVKSLDKKFTFDGCSRPVEVRFAETRGQRQQAMMASTVQPSNFGGINPSAIIYLLSQFINGGLSMSSLLNGVGGSPAVNGGVGGSAVNSNTVNASLNGAPVGGNSFSGNSVNNSFSGNSFGGPSAGGTVGGAAVGGGAVGNTPRQVGSWKEYFSNDGRPYYHNEISNKTQWNRPAEFDQPICVNSNVNAPVTPSRFNHVTAGAAVKSIPQAPISNEIGIGPPGANIFIFHVPLEWTQKDLLDTFGKFGNVISARIATDNRTKGADNKAKGYAFVSYDNMLSAVAAVNTMNGFMVGTKRLKVSIKKGEEHAAQHLLMGNTSNVNGCLGASGNSVTDGAVSNGFGSCLPNNLQQGLLKYNLQNGANMQYGRYTPY